MTAPHTKPVNCAYCWLAVPCVVGLLAGVIAPLTLQNFALMLLGIGTGIFVARSAL